MTLTEVRPDGQEMYLQRGWLRASHRALDDTISTATRPVHTHLEADAAPLPTEPVLVRVALSPIGHVFRVGSSVRIIVDAPVGRTGSRQFVPVLTPAINTVHVGPSGDSRLVVSVVEGGQAPAEVPLPDCGVPLSTDCRDNPFATVPAGSTPGGSGGAPGPDDGQVRDEATVRAAGELPATGFGDQPVVVALFLLAAAGFAAQVASRLRDPARVSSRSPRRGP